jgi:hypothetical protein
MAPRKKYKHAIEEYNLGEPEHLEARGQILRALSKIIGRKITGEAVLMMSRGTPAMLRTREEEKTDE